MANTENVGFEEVYCAHRNAISLYVHKRISNQHDAEELVSEIFEAACRYYPSYDAEKSSIATWLYIIAGSRLKNYFRKSRAIYIDIGELADFLPSAENGYESIEAAAQLQQQRNLLAKALESLSERSRQVVVMKYFLNQSTESIAGKLDTTSGNVRVILSRALRQMEQLIGTDNKKWEEITNG